MQEKIPETFVSEKEKAFEMAKAEDAYQILAINAKKVGLENLAKEYEKLGAGKAEEAGRKWKEEKEEKETKRKEIEEGIKNCMIDLLKKQKEIIDAEARGKETEESGYNIYSEGYIEDWDPESKIEQILGVEKLPYKVDEIPEIKREYYKTILERVIFRKILDLNSGNLIGKHIDLLPKEEWQKELEAMKEKNKE